MGTAVPAGKDRRPTTNEAARDALQRNRKSVREVYRVLPPYETAGACEVLYVTRRGVPRTAWIERNGDVYCADGW